MTAVEAGGGATRRAGGGGELAAAPGQSAQEPPGSAGGFARLWSSAVVSRFGDALRGAALPLLAVSLTDSPVLVSLVTACGFLPWLLFGLLGGALADRVDQRRTMWRVDVVRGLLMAGFAVAVAQDQATIGLLLTLSFILTTLQTLFDNAATALLPSVVDAKGLGRANARLMTGQEIAGRFVAAPLVPVLLGLGVAVPYAADAASYLVAAALVGSLRLAPPQRPTPPAGRTLRREVAEGIRMVWRDRALRALSLATTAANIGIGGLIATLVLLVTGSGWLAAGESGYAAIITAYGVGGVVGGLMATRMTEWLGQMRSLVGCGLVQVAALTVLGTVRSLPAAVAALGLFGMAGMVWNVSEVTMLQQRSPAAMLGRASSAFRTLSIAGAPVGAVLGGLVAASWGLNTPALLAAGLLGLGVLALIPVTAVRHS